MFNLFFSIEAKDERGSAFSLDTFSDKTFVITNGLSFLLVMSTVLRPFQTVLQTTRLDVRQWLTCTGVALSIIVVGRDQESGATTDCRQGCSRAA
jgi:Ca2+-transporting ATPase